MNNNRVESMNNWVESVKNRKWSVDNWLKSDKNWIESTNNWRLTICIPKLRRKCDTLDRKCQKLGRKCGLQNCLETTSRVPTKTLKFFQDPYSLGKIRPMRVNNQACQPTIFFSSNTDLTIWVKGHKFSWHLWCPIKKKIWRVWNVRTPA